MISATVRPLPPSAPPSAPILPLAPPVAAWQAVFFGGMAGALGWGIRGQYGHETGAMIAGGLVGLTLVLLLVPHWAPGQALRAAAWCAVAIGFGGSMTYGQTVGLTHDPQLVGNLGALRWGLIGLALKGGIWIGFAGLFLGMGLSGVRYRALELTVLMAGLLALFFLGRAWLNAPFDPAHRILPTLYFSADWRWLPDAALKPRREVWGGLLLALLGAILYVSFFRRDSLGWRLGAWGILAGALGFPLGQGLQALHAWNREWFQTGEWEGLDPLINWWNFMETTFGAVLGSVLGFGAWKCRARIPVVPLTELPAFRPIWEWIFAGVHTGLLLASELTDWSPVQGYAELSLVLGWIPIVLVGVGRIWPILLLLPITAAPIAAKTLQHLTYEEHLVSPALGWFLYLLLPALLTLLVSAALSAGVARPDQSPSDSDLRAVPAVRTTLLVVTWLYLGLNFAFFRFPWPWQPWTVRTPNAVIFFGCAAGLTWLALRATPGSDRK